MNVSEIKMGDVLFIYGNGFVDEAIEYISHGPSHCAIFVDNETLAEFQGFRKSGIIPLSDYLNADNSLEVWRDISLTELERNEISTYALHQSNKSYDYFAIFEELIHYELGFNIDDYHEGNRRICSSFVWDCGMSVGHDWSNIKHVPSPQDLLIGGKLTRIYKLK